MFLLSNNHLWSSSFKKYHHFSVFSVFIFSLFLTYRAIFQLLGSEEKSHINNLFLYWPQLTSLTVWILTCPGYVNLLRDGLLIDFIYNLLHLITAMTENIMQKRGLFVFADHSYEVLKNTFGVPNIFMKSNFLWSKI